MIKTITFQNFKSLKHLSIDFERLTVLVGPNASGKTSVLDAIHRFTQQYKKKPNRIFRGRHDPAEIATRGCKEPIEITCHVDGGISGCFVLTMKPLTNPRGKYFFERRFQSSSSSLTFEEDDTWRDHFPEDNLGSAVFLHLEPKRLAAASYSDHSNPRVGFDGGGLGAALAHLAITAPEQLGEIERSLKQIIPRVRKVRLRRSKVHFEELEPNRRQDYQEIVTHRTVWGHRVEFDFEGAKGVPAHFASEGTLIVLGILTVMHRPGTPLLVLIDELERGLHPGVLSLLVDSLRGLLEIKPDLQIIASAHSPYLIDSLSPEEVRMMTIDKSGSSSCRSMNAHPEYDKWKDQLEPGEFWSSIGEDWVAEKKEP